MPDDSADTLPLAQPQTAAAGVGGEAPYPIRFEADYPESLSRLSTFFRIILAIPLLIVVAILSDFSVFERGADAGGEGAAVSVGALGSLVVVYWIAVFLRQRPVNWLFDAIVHILRFSMRATTYLTLMTDKYPPFEGDWSVRLEVDKPATVSRWKIIFFKLITAIPHIIILIVLWLLALVVVFISWFAILFTGNYPRGLFDFVAGTIRWGARVEGYVFSLTDQYPPFSLE